MRPPPSLVAVSTATAAAVELLIVRSTGGLLHLPDLLLAVGGWLVLGGAATLWARRSQAAWAVGAGAVLAPLLVAAALVVPVAVPSGRALAAALVVVLAAGAWLWSARRSALVHRTAIGGRAAC